MSRLGYGHLHMPAIHWYDGVRFGEVSLRYPCERRSRRPMRRILALTGAA